MVYLSLNLKAELVSRPRPVSMLLVKGFNSSVDLPMMNPNNFADLPCVKFQVKLANSFYWLPPVLTSNVDGV